MSSMNDSHRSSFQTKVPDSYYSRGRGNALSSSNYQNPPWTNNFQSPNRMSYGKSHGKGFNQGKGNFAKGKGQFFNQGEYYAYPKFSDQGYGYNLKGGRGKGKGNNFFMRMWPGKATIKPTKEEAKARENNHREAMVIRIYGGMATA